ncbi:aryl-sulfate sulfotransferase [Desulfovibrio sp. OttesenSCG-928-C06]|nr:aryl-sulfate sulfotransferase [Desulfovibrio sp. OttesenSCG-928-C06]
MGHPTIYPTGVTVYNPDKCFSGYTILPVKEHGILLIDMHGKEIRLWKGMHGFPPKMLPGGYVLGSRGQRNGKYGFQDQMDVVQLDWDGNVVWEFDQVEFIEDPGEEPRWMARQHHDYQREGNPVGYYAPGLDPKVDSGNTMILCHRNLHNKKISDKELVDDLIVEVNWDGEIIWEWQCSDHFDELGFREASRNALSRDPNFRPIGKGMGDWMHINSMSLLGPNKWYDAGDKRFHPDNIIVDGRETNIMMIIEKATGKIVWKLGPDYDRTPEEKAIGWIIGMHHAHMIPRGLPGEGNILVYDNGGWAGYDNPNPGAPKGVKAALRDYSRVLEIDPVAMKIVWQYTPADAGFLFPMDSSRFYSPFVSGAQRLPNGNTLICEGSDGRIFEVTREHELVWEYISPYKGTALPLNMVYRAYRVPYEWVPQEPKPEETPILPLDVKTFRVPGAAAFGDRKAEIEIPGCSGFSSANALCVAAEGEFAEED